MSPIVHLFTRGSRSSETSQWDLDVRPRRSVRNARIVAVVIAVLFLVVGLLSGNSTTGVNFRAADQVALVCIGFLLAGAVLLLTRPRVRVGPQGVVVRNVLGDSRFQWSDIRGVSIPDKKPWARLELAGDDYAPMLAIRVNDKEHAARALDRFRELGAKYAGAAGE